MLKIQPLFIMTIFLLTGCTPAKTNKITSAIPQCLKSQSKCFVDSKFGKIEILFDQEKILTEIPFEIYLNLVEMSAVKDKIVKHKAEGKRLSYKIAKVKSHMEGKEMFMGRIPVFFSLSKQKEGMIAKTLLGSCSEEQMVWRLWLTVFFENNNASASHIEDKESLQKTFFIDFSSTRS